MSQRRVAVMAHFDPGQQLAPHVRRYLGQVARHADQTTLVSTSGVGAEGLGWAEANGVHVIERDNTGYDFASYATGLAASDVDLDTEVFITNDSFVGTTVPLPEIWQRMAASPADFWGMTRSIETVTHPDGTTTEEGREHIQSFFMVFRPQAANAAEFKRFWREVSPQEGKSNIIANHEVGLSQRLLADGFTLDASFKPTLADIWLAQRRGIWWQHRDAFGRHPLVAGLRTTVRNFRTRNTRLHFNPSLLLADAVFSGRLPLVKFQVLREDPATLGAGQFLTDLEQRFPTQFEGVREYLERTEPVYRAARGEADDWESPIPEPGAPGYGGFERMRYRARRSG